ncbi:MAG TPA: PEP/pyruvate-binding domain-containing protein [Candidatus Saccharibacteria bacterium]|nr:PEP/pyruvate-binding domain-containing protein [Candidatus Saccharibacteria bacterium]
MKSVVNLNEANDSSTFGGKASNLAQLINANLPVPGGLAISLNSFDASGKLTQEASQIILGGLEDGVLYAVRSSALAEDAEGASWAGQFESYLNVEPQDVLAKVEECHSSAKNRAKSYAEDKDISDFNIAVVVQKMLKPLYAGVLFTKDPVTGEDHMITEYVEGLGEELVSGRADPKRAVISTEQKSELPFDSIELAELGRKVQVVFGSEQDIEWVWADNKVWLVQARPITTAQSTRQGYYLGEPEDLFYWGPSRAQAMYMSDFFAGTERRFIEMFNDPELPNPPETLALFDGGKMVWLNNAEAFGRFTEQTFESYAKQGRIKADIAAWRTASEKLAGLKGDELAEALTDAWYHTEFAEFALYGSEVAISKKLSNFKSEERQEVWGAFSVPDKQTFLSRIDVELSESQDAEVVAKKYPWIQDGYDGLGGDVREYFQKRLEVLGKDVQPESNNSSRRDELIEKYNLSSEDLEALKLARELAEFMDDRKVWMMQTRKLIKQTVGSLEFGWHFKDGEASQLSEQDAHELWERYLDFKASTSAVKGIVASNGGRHFVNGEVAVVTSPTDVVKDGMIVVVPSTSPSYVPLMRKAKALVTDHGGMMSHAAIVAREFNLPCIVGTKQGTKVLTNGDKVVLDLVSGEVNK